MTTGGIDICRPCHSFLHRQFSEKELGRNFNSLQKILASEVILKHISGQKNKKEFRVERILVSYLADGIFVPVTLNLVTFGSSIYYLSTRTGALEFV